MGMLNPLLIDGMGWVGMVCRYVFSCFAAWPLTQHRLGHDTAVTWHVGGVLGFIVVLVQAVIAVIALDAYLYWKHRLLHQKFFWGMSHTL
jgi:sterol desaturase/sphingolipid hydroxylase (fatty acid hydroxylase superfamily)